MSEQTFTPVPLVPDRRLMRKPMPGRTAPNDPARIAYARKLVWMAYGRVRTASPSDDAILAAYERLAGQTREGGSDA